MTKYEQMDYEKMENHIEKVIGANLSIKSNHGFIYEVRQIQIGDNNIFKSNGKEFSVELQKKSFFAKHILEKDGDLLAKADRIAFNIIDEIDDQVSGLIAYSQISGRLAVFNRCIKIVVDNSVVIENNMAHIKFGVAIFN